MSAYMHMHVSMCAHTMHACMHRCVYVGMCTYVFVCAFTILLILFY